MTGVTKLSRAFKKFVSTHKDVEIPAFLGNIAGTVKADLKSNVYVVLQNGEELTVRNVRVPNVPRLPVIIGYDASNPTLLQVLRARDVYLTSPYPDLPDHADATHQWPKHDVLWVKGEQFLPGLVVPTTGLIVQLAGFVYHLNGWHSLDNQLIDISAEIPTTGAKYLLVEVDDAGAITFNAGAAVASRELLTYADIPEVSSVSKMPLVAIKVYAGQSSVLKSRLYTDIIDLRWSGYSNTSGVAGSLNWADLIDVPLVFPPDTTITDPLYVRKFEFAIAPTVDDDDVAGYLKNDLWHDTANRAYYLCHDNATGAADWFALGSGGGDSSFVVDGVLAVLAPASNVIVFTKDTTISEWYFHIEDKGSASTTILDIHYVGGASIFTTQANRPSIAYNAASNLVVAIPDITTFVAGDVLELHIDQIATGATSAVVIGSISGSGGSGGFNLVVEDGVTSVANVGDIVFEGATVTDDGGGQVTVKIMNDYILVRDEKSAGTNGGTFTSGAWQTRTINSEVSDASGHCTISSNQITLAAGTYLCSVIASAYYVERHQARLYNITDGATQLVGSSEVADNSSAVGVMTHSVVKGKFTIAASKTFEVQHRANATKATTGFGVAANFGEVEVYTIAEFWKVG